MNGQSLLMQLGFVLVLGAFLFMGVLGSAWLWVAVAGVALVAGCAASALLSLLGLSRSSRR